MKHKYFFILLLSQIMIPFFLTASDSGSEKYSDSRPSTPPNTQKVLEQKATRLASLKVTPNSQKKDEEIKLKRLAGAELELFRIYFNQETSQLFNKKNGPLKYQVIYFLHKNGFLYAMPVWYSEDEGYQHSSFDTSGEDCFMAGEMNITSSTIFINDDSGHYKSPSHAQTTQTRIDLVGSYLRKIGVRLPITRLMGGF